MATPGLQPEAKRQWSDFNPKYESLLSFIDVFYSAMLGFGLVLIGLIFDHHFDRGGFDWAAFTLLVFANLYLVGDYIDARLFTQEYRYESLKRFLVDLLIGAMFFGMFITGYHASPYFLVVMGVALALGGLWCGLLQHEAPRVKPLKFPWVIGFAHVVAGLILIGYGFLRIHHYWSQKLTVGEAWEAVGCYAAWSLSFIAAEWLLNIPSKEADLFPTFPIGRMIRNKRIMISTQNKIVVWGYRRIAVSLRGIRRGSQALENTFRRKHKQHEHQGE